MTADRQQAHAKSNLREMRSISLIGAKRINYTFRPVRALPAISMIIKGCYKDE